MNYISMIAAMKDNMYSSMRSLKVSLVVHPQPWSYDERKKWNLQGMESTPWTQELNTRKNMKIWRKKEKPEQPVIVLRITRLLAWYELTKRNKAEELKVVMKNNVWLMNESIARSRTRGSLRWRRLWWLLVLVHQTYHYMSHYIICNIHELEFYIR